MSEQAPRSTGNPEEQNTDILLPQDPRMTTELVDAIKGPVTAHEDVPVEIDEYAGTDVQLLSQDPPIATPKHIFSAHNMEGHEEYVALDEVSFPEDRRQELEDAGLTLNEGGKLDDNDPLFEVDSSMMPTIENDQAPQEQDDPASMEGPAFGSGVAVLYGRRDKKAEGRLQYDRDENGNLLTGEVYRAVGDVMKWSQNPQTSGQDRRIIMHASDGSGKHKALYVQGNRIYEIDQSRPNRTSSKSPEYKLKVQDLQDGESLPDLTIGQDIGGGLILENVHVLGRKLPYIANPADEERLLREAGKRLMPQNAPKGHMPKMGKTASNPFKDIEALIASIEDGRTSPGNAQTPPTEEQPTVSQPDTVARHESAEPSDNLEDQIKQFAERFSDKTYVPTLDEYEQMRELAGRIRIDYGEEDGNEPMRYLNVDGRQLNAKAARDFLDRVDTKRWVMKHRDADVAEDLYEHATTLNIRRLDLPQRTTRDWLSFRQFAEERAPEQNQDGELPGEELVNQYKEYIKRRVDLSDTLTGRQNKHETGEVVTANDIAMDALKSFREGVRERSRSRAALATAKKAAQKIHNASMKVDVAVRNKMDATADKAAAAKAKAEEFKELWDGDLEEILTHPPQTTNQEALRDYLDRQRLLEEQRKEAIKAAPKALVKRAAAKVSRGRRRR